MIIDQLAVRALAAVADHRDLEVTPHEYLLFKHMDGREWDAALLRAGATGENLGSLTVRLRRPVEGIRDRTDLYVSRSIQP